jgi:uncharacterized repeat protein (TIGR03806 family)
MKNVRLVILITSLLPGVLFAQQPYGLKKRVLWTQSRVVGFPDPPLPYRLERVFRELTFKQPIATGIFPGNDLIWVATHQGSYGGDSQIRVFADKPDVDSTELFLQRPEIVYGLAFHPRFAENGYLFVGCNGKSEELGEVATKVLRFTLEPSLPYSCDPNSSQVVIQWPSNGHNGGDLAFGPDGMLYVSAGDGTSDSDLNLAGQDLSTLPGSILRIDVDHASAGKQYSVPADNPFINTPGARPEIWAYGFRNPWRITFDVNTGQLWVGNNGQDHWESVHLVQRGENHGWSVFEGSHPFRLQRQRGPTPPVAPIVEHPHSEARSLTGGVVYNGSKHPTLRGAYLYGDYATGNVWAVRHDTVRVTWKQQLSRSTLQIAGFGIDSSGEPVIVDHGGGLYQLAPNLPQPDAPPFPRLLSETGLYNSTTENRVDDALIPYSVNAPLWSDGSSKERFIALPGKEQIGFKAKGGWDFPDGAVLVKTFSLNVDDDSTAKPRRIETRLLHRQDGEWYGYSYAWNKQQTDAELVAAAGMDQNFDTGDGSESRNQTWHYPSRSECMVCHSRAANFVLGLSTAQMNKAHDYDGVTDNQLRALEQIGVLSVDGKSKLPKRPEQYPQLANPLDETSSLEDRARAYLHANCANCHMDAGGGNSNIALEFDTKGEKMSLFDAPPVHDSYGIANAKLIASGAPQQSVLLQRVSRRGAGQMPPLGSSLVDKAGIRLLDQWIRSLKVANESSE